MQDKKTTTKLESIGMGTAWESKDICRIRAGDMDATARFIRYYQPKVRKAILRVLQEPASVTAATRATFKTAVRRLQRGRQVGALCPWLMRIARDEALTQIRARHALETKEDRSKSSSCDLPPLRPGGNGRAPAEDSKRRSARRSAVRSTAFLAGLCAALLWCVLGILSKNEILSLPDWGYGWFNTHILPIF